MVNEDSHTTAPPQQTPTHNTHHHTHNVDHQLVIGADDNKRINIVGHMNVLHHGLPEPGGMWARRFFYLHQDSCANCVVVGSDAARACMKNVRAAHPDDHILMNSHAARVVEYGDLCIELFDEHTHVGGGDNRERRLRARVTVRFVGVQRIPKAARAGGGDGVS